MTPEEITALFTTAAATFTPITGQPTDDDLTALREVLYPHIVIRYSTSYTNTAP